MKTEEMKSLREGHDLSQAELARSAGVYRCCYRAIEADTCRVDRQTLRKIEKMLALLAAAQAESGVVE